MSSLASTLLAQAAAEYVATSGAAASLNRAAQDATRFVTDHSFWFIGGAIALFVLWRLLGPAR